MQPIVTAELVREVEASCSIGADVEVIEQTERGVQFHHCLRTLELLTDCASRAVGARCFWLLLERV